VNALDSSAAVFTSMARSAAIFGITGSTARENSVEAKITRLTILRTGGMARLLVCEKTMIRHPEVRAKRASKDAAEALGLSPHPKSGLPDFGTLTIKSATAD